MSKESDQSCTNTVINFFTSPMCFPKGLPVEHNKLHYGRIASRAILNRFLIKDVDGNKRRLSVWKVSDVEAMK